LKALAREDFDVVCQMKGEEKKEEWEEEDDGGGEGEGRRIIW